jgi:hypothetical protein
MSSFDVLFGFFSILAATQEMLLQSGALRGPILILMSSKIPPFIGSQDVPKHP